MASDTSLVFNLIGRDRVSDDLRTLRRNFERLGGSLAKVGGVALTATPLVGALAVAFGGVAASMASAGLAAGAFGLAVKPQLTDVTKASQLYTAAQDAVALGGAAAADAQKAYADALAGMPPATRDAATAFIDLKTNFSEWSDALASSTMPVFTKGIGVLNELLPMLTPFVRDAADALSDFMDDIAAGVKSSGFHDFMSDMQKTAKDVIPNLLTSVGNIVTGIGGLVQAFLPANSGMGEFSDGLVTATGAFSDWATKLQDSPAFGKITDLAKSVGPALLNLITAALGFIQAIAPLMGTTATLMTAVATVVSAIPPDVLTGIALGLTAIGLAVKAWAISQAIWNTAVGIAAAVQTAFNTALLLSPWTWIALAIVAVIAIIVLIATKTTWFQTIWETVWGAVKTAVNAVWTFIRDYIFNPLVTFFTVTIPNAAQFLWQKIQMIWNAIKTAINTAWTWIKTNVLNPIINFFTVTIPNAAGTVKQKIVDAWNQIRQKVHDIVWDVINWVKGKWNDLVDFFSGLPNRITNAVSGMFNGIKSAFRSAVNWLIRKWNGLSFGMNGIHINIPHFPDIDIPGFHLRTPNIPLLAKGGNVMGSGSAIVGEAGPEMLSLPRGARVTPLGGSRAAGRSESKPVVLEIRSGGSDLDNVLVEVLRRTIRRQGGDVQVVLGT